MHGFPCFRKLRASPEHRVVFPDPWLPFTTTRPGDSRFPCVSSKIWSKPCETLEGLGRLGASSRTGFSGLSVEGGRENLGWSASFADCSIGAEGFTERTGGAEGGGGAVAAGGCGAAIGLSGSGPFFPPGPIIIGRLVGVALGGTHSAVLCNENAPGCSPPIEFASEGKSLSRDCSSLLRELSSSPCGGPCQLLGG